MKARDKNIFPLLITVLCVAVRLTQAQVYLLTFGQNQRSYHNGNSVFNVHSYPKPDILKNASSEETYDSDDIPSVIYHINSTTTNTDPSKSNVIPMDVVTAVWYVATFLALATFFLLMTCPNRGESPNTNSGNYNNRNNDDDVVMNKPLTPTPSYSEFAPPSYESVMKSEFDDKLKIYCIPLNGTHCDTAKDYNSENNNNIITPKATFNIQTINEIQKF